MNVLILTGRFGMGHCSVAETLKQDIENNFGDTNTTVVDIFEYMAPNLCEVIYGGFKLLVNRGSKLYNFFYKKADQGDSYFETLFIKQIAHKIDSLINEIKPSIIISTLPICSKVISAYKEITGSNIIFITCITDISIHKEWVNPHTNIYIVASKKVKDNLILRGIEEKNILVSGIPVRKQFKNIEILSKNTQKEKSLLIMGGGLGLIPASKDFYKKINNIKNLKTTVIAGNNRSLYNKLYNKYENIKVIGYTNKVYKYMQNADLIISKAGGVTLFETIYSELPIMVICPFLEQEINNAHYIENMGIGKIIWNKPNDMALEIENMINDACTLEKIKSNMKFIKNSLDENKILDVLNKVQMRSVS